MVVGITRAAYMITEKGSGWKKKVVIMYPNEIKC
jgi:hypothetical protein